MTGNSCLNSTLSNRIKLLLVRISVTYMIFYTDIRGQTLGLSALELHD